MTTFTHQLLGDVKHYTLISCSQEKHQP